MIPYYVSRFLFNGIYDALDLTEKQLECGEFNKFDEQRLNDLINTISWYKENCIISSEQLVEKLEKIKEKYKK